MARGMNMLVLMVLLGAAIQSCSAQTTHVVGDSLGWVVPPGGVIAYSAWAANETFVVGDPLVFNFVNGKQNVAEVTKSAYDSCNTTSTVSVYTVPPVRIILATPGEHFYTSTYPDRCSLGQKLAINVTGSSATTPSLSPATPPSSTATATPPSTSTSPSPPSTTTTTTTPSPAGCANLPPPGNSAAYTVPPVRINGTGSSATTPSPSPAATTPSPSSLSPATPPSSTATPPSTSTSPSPPSTTTTPSPAGSATPPSPGNSAASLSVTGLFSGMLSVAIMLLY